MLIFDSGGSFPCVSALALPLLILMLAWLFYKVTAYALPCLTGLIVARYAFEAGAGWFGAIVVWGVTALVAFGLMRWLYASVTQPILRAALSVAFVTPSAVMSYFISNNLSAGHVPSETWRQALCIFGAGVAGLMALARLAEPEPDPFPDSGAAPPDSGHWSSFFPISRTSSGKC